MASLENDYEKLFLLEVLVDSVTVSTSKLNLDKSLASDTCVIFQFLHYPPLVVCESDFLGHPSGLSDSHVTFRSGKSCFFSLRSPRGPILPVPFIVQVSVVRRLGEDVLPGKVEVGKTSIDMSDSFTDLLKRNTDNCDALPLSSTNKGVFEIKDEYGESVGKVSAFLRLSCFGKLIITQFSLDKDDEKSYLFKGTEFNKLCESPCAKSKPSNVVDHIFTTPTVGDRRTFENSPSETPMIRDPYKRDTKPDFSVMGYPQSHPPRDPLCGVNSYARDDRRYDGGGYRGGSQPNCYPIDFPSRSPISGSRPPPTPSSRPDRGMLCECPCPVPRGVVPKYPQRQKSDREYKYSLAPGEVGLQDDQVIFQLPLKKQGEPLTERDKKIDSSVYYKLTSAEETREGKQKNTVHIKSDDLPGMAAKEAVGPVSGLPVDDKHDVFLLKIGKKCDGDKKRNLELELRTPKMKEPKPETRDQDSQYLEADCAESKEKGKGKDKKKPKSEKGSKKGKKGKK